MGPTLLALIAWFWLPCGVVMGGRRISKAIGSALCGSSLLALIVLFRALPELDALDTPAQVGWALRCLVHSRGPTLVRHG